LKLFFSLIFINLLVQLLLNSAGFAADIFPPIPYKVKRALVVSKKYLNRAKDCLNCRKNRQGRNSREQQEQQGIEITVEAVKPKLELTPDDARELLSDAVKNADDELTRELLDFGTKPIVNILNVAAKRPDNAKVVQLLIDGRANVDKVSFDSTPLHEAAAYGSSDVVSILLNANAHLETYFCSDGQIIVSTPLYCAVETGSLGAVKFLLAAGANPSPTGPRGQSSIAVLASERDRREGGQYFSNALSGGLGLFGRCVRRRTPQWFSNWIRKDPPVQPCTDRECKHIDEFQSALIHSDVQAAQAIFRQHPIDVNIGRILLPPPHRDPLIPHYERKHICTPLEIVLDELNEPRYRDKTEREPMVKFLIESKADVNQESSDGNGPLFLALRRGQTGAARLLLNARADVQIALEQIRMTEEAGRPLISAAVEMGRVPMVNLLIEFGFLSGSLGPFVATAVTNDYPEMLGNTRLLDAMSLSLWSSDREGKMPADSVTGRNAAIALRLEKYRPFVYDRCRREVLPFLNHVAALSDLVADFVMGGRGGKALAVSSLARPLR